ncbi:hypothetical protein D3C75_914500 [compost metagenome]
MQTATVAEGSTSIKLTGLDFGTDSTTIYISLKKPDLTESYAVPIYVYSEASYAELATTVADAFKDQVLPGTMSVGDVVYLPDPQQPLPADLKVTVLNYDGPSTVTEDVYILRDYYVWYMNYNGTADPVSYNINLELKRDFSAVTKEIIITVPSVFTALPDSIALAETMLQNGSTQPGLAEAVNAAQAVIADTDATAADWIGALQALHAIFNQIARDNE